MVGRIRPQRQWHRGPSGRHPPTSVTTWVSKANGFAASALASGNVALTPPTRVASDALLGGRPSVLFNGNNVLRTVNGAEFDALRKAYTIALVTYATGFPEDQGVFQVRFNVNEPHCATGCILWGGGTTALNMLMP